MNKNVQDLIIVLRDGRKLPCSLDVNLCSGDIDIELQQWAEEDYDQIARIDPWKGVKAVRLRDGTVIHCREIYPDKEELESYMEAADGLARLGHTDGYFELLQDDDINNL